MMSTVGLHGAVLAGYSEGTRNASTVELWGNPSIAVFAWVPPPLELPEVVIAGQESP